MRGRSSFLVLASVTVVVGCGERPNPAGPSAEVPSAMISDGRFVGGNDDFFFLPPLLRDPKGSPNYDAGAFNARLGPTVSVCLLAANPLTTPTTDCALDADGNPVLVASFASNQVLVSVSGEQYHVNWHTDESKLFVDSLYRLQVFLGAVRIGFADIDPVSSGRDLKNVNTGEAIALVDGRTLPVRFRIENGVLCRKNKSDCGEFLVTDAGGTFVTNSGFAGIRFLEGFLPAGVSEITLKIERVVVGADNRCHGRASSLLWKEYEGCYEMTSDPDLEPFGGIRQPAIAAQCTEVPSIDPLYDFLQPYKSKNDTNLTRLANAEATFIDCEGFEGSPSSTAHGSYPALRFAAAGLRRIGDGIGKLFGVGTLHAIDLGLGEELPIGSSLSRFNWAIGLEAEVSGGAGQSAGFGLPTPQPLEVHVKSLHFHSGSEGDDVDDEHREDVPGVEVIFTVIEGDGHLGLDSDLTPLLTRSALTDARGRASVSFTAASNSTGNLVTATLPTFVGGPMTFSIAGLPPDLVIENLARSLAEPTTADALSWTFDVRNVGQGIAIASTARLVVSLEEDGTEEVASFDFSVSRLLPGAAVTLTTPVLAAPREAGDHSVSVTVDAGGQVTETNDANNAASEDFTVVSRTGILSGTVMDARTGAPLANVNIAIVGREIGAVTNVVGRYRFSNVQPGTYTLRASFIGYSPVDRTVTATAGNEVVTDFSLEPDVIFMANFDGDVVDAPPGPPAIGQWTLIAPTDGTILVRNAVSSLESKPVEVDNRGVESGTPGLHAHVVGTGPSTGTYIVRWRSVIASAASGLEEFWATTISLSSETVDMIAIVAYLPDGQLNYANSFSTEEQVATWVEGVTQLFEITVNLDAKTTSLSIDGEPVGLAQNRPFTEATATNLSRWRIGGGGTDPNRLGVDDIEIRRMP